MVAARSSGGQTIIPPPLIFPPAGSPPASATPTATAASTAFPPRFKIPTPAFDPNSSSVATMALAPRTASRGQLLAASVCVRYSAAACARAISGASTEATEAKQKTHNHAVGWFLIANQRH